MKSHIVEIVDIVSLVKLGERFTSWNRYFIVNNLLCPTCS